MTLDTGLLIGLIAVLTAIVGYLIWKIGIRMTENFGYYGFLTWILATMFGILVGMGISL